MNVPIINRCSKLAYNITNYVYYVRSEHRELAEEYIAYRETGKKFLGVKMGPIPQHRLIVTLAFYTTHSTVVFCEEICALVEDSSRIPLLQFGCKQTAKGIDMMIQPVKMFNFVVRTTNIEAVPPGHMQNINECNFPRLVWN